MKTLYKYVEFNEKFLHHKAGEPDIEYTKTNYQRGFWINKETGRKVFMRFKKTDIVVSNIPENMFTEWMRVQ